MDSRYPHDEAVRLAGDIFGRILDRKADPDGYQYVLDCLEGGKKTVQQILLEFIASDEFIDRFAAGICPAHTANLVNKLLLGRSLYLDQDVQIARRQFVRIGIKRYAEQITNSVEYARKFGAHSVPHFGH